MKNYPKHSGFTLIELIIVIGIISLLALVSIGRYGQVRNSAELSQQVDEIVSELRKLQAKSQNAATGLCMGLQFNQTPENPGIFYIEAEYTNPIRKCNLEQITDSYYEKNLKTHTITLDDSTRQPAAINILFYPPKGEIYIPAFPSDSVTLQLSLKNKIGNHQIVINQANGTIQKQAIAPTE